MNNTEPNNTLSRSESIKKFMILTTIVVVTLCALLAIAAIFVGTEPVLLNLISTLFIMYLAIVCSTKNTTRLDNPLPSVRLLSGFSLFANIVWGILWILLVWDVFGGLDVDTRIILWKLVGSAAVISIFCTILAISVARVFSVNYPTIIKVYKSLPLVCAVFFGLDILLIIWVSYDDADLIGKFFLAECILIFLQFIVTRILLSNANRLGIDIGFIQNRPNAVGSPSQMPTQGNPQVPQTGSDSSTLKTVLIVIGCIVGLPIAFALIVSLILIVL